jgi:hypothetical protein
MSHYYVTRYNYTNNTRNNFVFDWEGVRSRFGRTKGQNKRERGSVSALTNGELTNGEKTALTNGEVQCHLSFPIDHISHNSGK